MKKSAKSKEFNLTGNSLRILQELLEYPEGLRVKTLSKLLGIKQRNLYKYLNKLKKGGLIKNIFPMWKLTPDTLHYFKSKSQKSAKLLKSGKIQAHNISFVLKLIKKPSWWEKRANRLIKIKEFQFRQITWGKNPYIQLLKDNFVIQLFSNSIIFISRKKYYGYDAYDCFIQAVSDFLDIYHYLQEKFAYTLFLDEIPQVSVRSHHYVHIGDSIAKNCKKTGNKFQVWIDGKLRMWVDISEPLGLETGHKDYAPEDMSRYQPYVADMLINNPPKLSEINNRQEFIEKNIADFSYNLRIHKKVLQDISQAINELRKEIKKLRK